VPFGPVKDKQRRRLIIEVPGPRSKKEQAAFRTAPMRVLKKHKAKITRRPRRGGS
jgi:hypothetical protein